MSETYLQIREQLETVIKDIASLELELGTSEEMVEPITALAEAVHSPFCLVVLGEKGSGKSSLLNAFIREDLSPLDTNEEKIKVFRYGKKETDRLVADDLEECTRPLPALRNFTLIDTPANLLLGDARLLTRDIFPIADLVLCIFSVSNPWAPSTWEFLRNVKKEWLSKVVFVVQQIDLREEHEIQAVAKSLTSHSHDCLGVAPVLFSISAKQASQDPEGRVASGIEALEKYIEERTGASQGPIQKARATCQAARGPLIDIAERVRGTLYLANLEKTKLEELAQILAVSKESARQEVREVVKTVTDSYLRSQGQGEELLKTRLTLLQTLRSAFQSHSWELPQQEELENAVRQEIVKATERIKSELMEGSKRFQESSIFAREEENQAIGVAIGAHGKQLSEHIRKTLARNRTEALDDTMNDILDAAGATIRVPAICSAVGLLAMLLTSPLVTSKFPMSFGLAAAATAVALAITLLIVVRKHTAILAEYHLQIGQKRERVVNTIDRQLNEAINTFCDKHLLLLPASTFSDAAQQRLSPFLPRIKELEDTLSGIEARLTLLLQEAP